MGGFSGELWPVHPHRLPDELLSFWILRTAHANRIKLQTFTNTTFGRDASPWARDVDRSASPAFLAILSKRTGSPVEDLKGGMLSNYEGIVFERHNAAGKTPWVLPLGIYHRTRKAYGMQFCPACLFEDPVPYFRRQWRLAFATICDRHGTLLHDRCPQCGAPVIYFRNDLGHRQKGRLGDHTLCWQCQYDLRRAAMWGADWLDAETYIALRSLLTFIDGGFAVAGPHFFDYAHLFLAVLHRVCEMLTSNGTKRRYDRLKEVVARETGLGLPHGTGRGAFESLDVMGRHRVLLCSLWLMLDWPERFVAICGKAQLSRAFLLGDLDVAPYWFEQVLKGHLDRSLYVVTAEEVASAVEYLTRQGSPVSRKSLQAVLGGRDNRATVSYALKLRSPWPQTDEEFDRLLTAIDKRIADLSVGGVRRLLAERDRVIFLVMKVTGWSAKTVLGLEWSEGGLLPMVKNLKYPQWLIDELGKYITTTRKALVGQGVEGRLFAGLRSNGISVENLAFRAKKLR